MKDLNTPQFLALLRTKVFTFKDLWLFLIGILFVSMTSGAIGAFMLGVRDEEFFIGEADNIFIVTEHGTTTPITGKVHENIKSWSSKSELITGDKEGIMIIQKVSS